jgi:hypothetical protein
MYQQKRGKVNSGNIKFEPTARLHQWRQAGKCMQSQVEGLDIILNTSTFLKLELIETAT